MGAMSKKNSIAEANSGSQLQVSTIKQQLHTLKVLTT